MNRCVTTKYLGPTDTKGSRVAAYSSHGKRIVPYDSALSPRMNHHAAAVELACVNGWIAYTESTTVELAHGSLPDETGYAFLVPGY